MGGRGDDELRTSLVRCVDPREPRSNGTARVTSRAARPRSGTAISSLGFEATPATLAARAPRGARSRLRRWGLDVSPTRASGDTSNLPVRHVYRPE